jgi:hypothetical protein
MSNYGHSTKRYLLMLLCVVLARAIGRVPVGMGDTNRDGICERTGKPVGEGCSPVNGGDTVWAEIVTTAHRRRRRSSQRITKAD